MDSGSLGFRVVLGSDCQIRATVRGKVTLCHKMRGFGNPLRAKPREILETLDSEGVANYR
jgi:hypothetical protein